MGRKNKYAPAATALPRPADCPAQPAMGATNPAALGPRGRGRDAGGKGSFAMPCKQAASRARCGVLPLHQNAAKADLAQQSCACGAALDGLPTTAAHPTDGRSQNGASPRPQHTNGPTPHVPSTKWARRRAKRKAMAAGPAMPKVDSSHPVPATPAAAGAAGLSVPALEGAAVAVVQGPVTALPNKGAPPGANWARLQAALCGGASRKRKAPDGNTAPPPRRAVLQQPPALPRPEARGVGQGAAESLVALDCEMVGVGLGGARSSLARVCMVDGAGTVLLDRFVAQRERVTDFRTHISGVRGPDLKEGAAPLAEVQVQVAGLLAGRILVGHSVDKDLAALMLSHPRRATRDTARFPPLMRATAPGRRPRPCALRLLAAQHLGLGIQGGEHSPVDDARAALYLYLRYQKVWEDALRHGTLKSLKPPGAGTSKGSLKGKRAVEKSLEELAAEDDMVDL